MNLLFDIVVFGTKIDEIISSIIFHLPNFIDINSKHNQQNSFDTWWFLEQK